MGSTTPGIETNVGSRRGSATGPALAHVRGRRRPWLIGLGALLASIGALTVVWLVGAAGQRQEVLAMRSDVAYGQELTSDDITVARVSVDPGVAVLPATDRESVVGQVATTQLSAGMLLTSAMVEVTGDPGPGLVLVPLALPAERMPAGGLRAGDQILAVDSEGSVATPPIPATVVRVGPMDINGITVVDVTTAAASGPGLAVSSANSHVALVVQPTGVG